MHANFKGRINSRGEKRNQKAALVPNPVQKGPPTHEKKKRENLVRSGEKKKKGGATKKPVI